MYALYGANGTISLYEGGEHDHGRIRVPGMARQTRLSTLDVSDVQQLNMSLPSQVVKLDQPTEPISTLMENVTGDKLCTVFLSLPAQHRV